MALIREPRESTLALVEPVGPAPPQDALMSGEAVAYQIARLERLRRVANKLIRMKIEPQEARALLTVMKHEIDRARDALRLRG